jgi:hypothetical protein
MCEELKNNKHDFLFDKLGGRRLLSISRLGWEDSIKLNIEEVSNEEVG